MGTFYQRLLATKAPRHKVSQSGFKRLCASFVSLWLRSRISVSPTDPVIYLWSIVLLAFVFVKSQASAQTFFKVLEEPHLFFNQRIAHFPNGDLLIGDSSLESLSNGGTNGTVFLNRRDPCGHVVWSYSYVLPQGHLELKDFKINDSGEIFVYGSFYQGLSERIFLLKVDGVTGKNEDYKLYHPGTVDHFSYSLDLKGNLIMIYGLLLDFNTQKQGFVALFNQNLAFLSAKNFTPFESSGTAIISNDQGFIARSGQDLIKLDAQGNLEWASLLDAGPNIHPVAGPLEVSGGFIMEAHWEDQSFFYKVDAQGQLVWQTNLFPATSFGSAMSVLSDGMVLCTYSSPDESTNRLCQLVLSPGGEILTQRQLVLGHTLNSGAIYQSISSSQSLVISGNVNPTATQTADIADYVVQFALDSLSNDCFYWEDFRETAPNNIVVAFSFVDLNVTDFNMVLEQSIQTDTIGFRLPLMEICEEPIPPAVMHQDTLLPCGEDWIVNLPSPNFVWTDGIPGNSRVISQPGTYRARSRGCADPVIVQYTLQKEACGCQVYLPTAFSPNNDGINDQLELFSDCLLDVLEMSVFSRWGDRVFYSNSPGEFWTGRFQHKVVPAGVYVVYLEYQWTDFDGNVQEGRLVQEVTLVR